MTRTAEIIGLKTSIIRKTSTSALAHFFKNIPNYLNSPYIKQFRVKAMINSSKPDEPVFWMDSWLPFYQISTAVLGSWSSRH